MDCTAQEIQSTEFPGLTIVGARLAMEGAPTVGFDPGDAVDDVDAGCFLTQTAMFAAGAITILFDEPAYEISIDVYDVDFSEAVDVAALDADGVLLESVRLNSRVPGTGNRVATTVTLTATNVASLRVDLLSSGGIGADSLRWTVDDDSDGDGVLDAVDGCPDEDATGWDADGDGCIDDTDGDGWYDDVDACPGSDDTLGSAVDADGCTVSDYCPCDSDWDTHGDIVDCASDIAREFRAEGVITWSEKGAITSDAAHMECGDTTAEASGTGCDDDDDDDHGHGHGHGHHR